MRPNYMHSIALPRAVSGLIGVRAEADPKTVLAKLGPAFETFKASYNERVTALEGEVDALAIKAAAGILNGGGSLRPEDPDYTKTFATYFRNGETEADLRAANATGYRAQIQAAMSVGTNSDGGYLAPVEWDREIRKARRLTSPMRRIAQVQTTGVGAFSTVWSDDSWGSGWVGETAARPATTSPTLSSLVFGTGEIYANVAVTQRLLDDADFKLETWLADQVNGEFGRQEDLAFISGNGVNKPYGLLTFVTGGAGAGIPDMVDEIGQHMARLQGNMVDPTEKATQSTAEKFRDMAGQISDVMDSLYPEIAALRAELASLALLEGDPNTPFDAIMRQRQRVADAQGRATAEASPALERPDATLPGELVGLPGVPMPVPALEQMNELGLTLRDTFDRMGGKTGEALANITDGLLNAVIPALFRTQAQAEAAGASLAQMGQGLTSLFSGIFGKKAGGILGAIGTIGLKIAGFRESGGPVSAGKAYVVGEKRPEIFVPKGPGTILPNLNMRMPEMVRPEFDRYVGASGDMRERQTRILVQVEEGALFRPVVTQIAGGVAAPMAVRAAMAGSEGGQTAIMRKQRRRLA